MNSEQLARADAERAAYLESKIKRKRSPIAGRKVTWKVGRPPAALPANWVEMHTSIRSHIGDYHRDDARLIIVCVACRLGMSPVAVARTLGISKQHARQILVSLPRPKHVDTRRLVEAIAAICPKPVWSQRDRSHD